MRVDSGVIIGRESVGLLLGVLGVAAFSVTLPATRIAVAELDPVFVGLGRTVGAAVPAALMLWSWPGPRPTAGELGRLALVAAGVVVGFPVLSAIAMRTVHASHGGVVLGLLPLVTALIGAWLAGERPSARFWAAAVAGSLLVLLFVMLTGSGALAIGDVALLGAVIAAAFGYAEGARLTHRLGGWRVICWAVVLSAPLLLLPVAWRYQARMLDASAHAWLAFGYLILFSQLLGFVPWYQGLAMGGIARVSQVQLLQPFFTLSVAAVLLAERITLLTLVFAVLVVATVAIGRRMPIRRAATQVSH